MESRSLEDHGWYLMLQLEEQESLKIRLEIPGYGIPRHGSFCKCIIHCGSAWETWYLPRPQPIDPVLIDSPDAWELDAHYPSGFEPHTFPPKPIPISMATREANLIGYLSPQKG